MIRKNSNFLKTVKQNSGITLVTLVTTIIIMLILAGVTISSIQDDGTTDYAENTAGNYNQGITGLEEYKDWLQTQSSKYKYVEYLGSTGTQYIDTGVIPTNHTLIIDFQFYDDPARDGHAIFGAQDSNSVYKWIYNGNNDAYYTWCGEGSGLFYGHECEERQTVIFNDELNRTLIDGSVKTTMTNTENEINTSIYLFGLNKNSAIVSSSLVEAKIYSCKIINKTTGLVERNLIPCYRVSDNVAGMYDTVNDVFYTNQGTGTFVVGNDV